MFHSMQFLIILNFHFSHHKYIYHLREFSKMPKMFVTLLAVSTPQPELRKNSQDIHKLSRSETTPNKHQ